MRRPTRSGRGRPGSSSTRSRSSFTAAAERAARAVLAAALALALAFAGLELALRAAGLAVLAARRAKLMAASEGKRRVLCLGESTTFGALTSYPAELQKLLDARGPGWVVFNLGRPGVSTDAIIQPLESDLALYRPDVVVAMMGINDTGASALVMQGVRARYRTRVGRLLALGFSGIFSTRFPNEGGPWLARRADDAAALRARARRALDAGYPRTSCLLLRLGRIALSRDTEDGRLGRAACALALGDRERAAALLEGSTRWPDWDQEEYVQAARAIDDGGDNLPPESVRLYDRALDVDAERGRWLEALERGFAAAGDARAAGRAAEERRRGEVLSAPLPVWRAEACWRSSRADSCWQGLDAELDRRERFLNGAPAAWRPNAGLARWLAARFAGLRGDDAASERELRRSLELDPYGEEAAKRLSQLLARDGKLREGRQVLERSLALEPGSPSRLGRLAAFEQLAGRPSRAAALRKRAERLAAPLPPGTAANYVRLADALARRRIPLICLAYPTQNADALRAALGARPGVWFVDDQDGFREELERLGPAAIFTDMFAGSFGHCTPLGYRLLARNVLPAVLAVVGEKR